MTGEGTRLIAAIVAAVLAAGMLSACGDSDSTPTSNQGSSTNGSGEASAEGGDAQGAEGGPGSGSDGSGDSRDGEAPAEPVATPLQVSGGGSDQFRVEGGDNSVQEFGEEADESELQEAAEAVHDFYVARAEGDWEGACSRLSRSLLERLENLATSSTNLEDKGCAPFLEAFTTQLSPAEWREVTTIDAGSLRHEGEQGFLIYYGAPDKTVYSMPLALEDDEWKVTALSGSALSAPAAAG